VSYVTQITNIHVCVRETCGFHFLTYRKKQINYTYRVFRECLNLCDDGENVSNIKKPTVSLLPEHQFRSNLKLRVRKIMGKFLEKKCAKKQA